MTGIAIVLDLVRKNRGSGLSGQNLHSYTLFSASLAASAAAASVAAGNLFPSRALFGYNPKSVAFCDATVSAFPEGFIPSIESASKNIFQKDSLTYSTKEYIIDLKPLFSAFHWRNFALTSLRSFLACYLPLLEPRTNVEEDDEDFLEDSPDTQHIDLVTPFKKSMKQIVRETTVVTTRRILERLAVHYVSQRLAWKLLKDVPKSAVRKAGRGMPTVVYLFNVSRTTFRAHLLGVLASWLVQVGIEIYRFFSYQWVSKDEPDEVNEAEQLKRLGKNVYFATLRSGSSLICASICGGIGATVLTPSAGQWIGCAIGDLAGPIFVIIFVEKASHVEL